MGSSLKFVSRDNYFIHFGLIFFDSDFYKKCDFNHMFLRWFDNYTHVMRALKPSHEYSNYENKVFFGSLCKLPH